MAYFNNNLKHARGKNALKLTTGTQFWQVLKEHRQFYPHNKSQPCQGKRIKDSTKMFGFCSILHFFCVCGTGLYTC